MSANETKRLSFAESMKHGATEKHVSKDCSHHLLWFQEAEHQALSLSKVHGCARFAALLQEGGRKMWLANQVKIVLVSST